MIVSMLKQWVPLLPYITLGLIVYLFIVLLIARFAGFNNLKDDEVPHDNH